MNYHKKKLFDLEADLSPRFSHILQKAFSISPNIVVQLPRNIDVKQLIRLIQQHLDEKRVQRVSIEIEQFYLNNQLNQLIVYFGSIVRARQDDEWECIARGGQPQVGKHQIKSQGALQVLRGLAVED